ncbi:MAG: SpoIIE family protein phosphatase [Phycisphaeraceae bacterium]|nr:SpoIIE family protein phosphatase [Phycisphaeraceae bacterium]
MDLQTHEPDAMIEPRAGLPAAMQTPPINPAQTTQGEVGLSVRDFLTDGSLARMCDELTRMSGVPVWLRDADGQVIVPGDGQARWRSVAETPGRARAYALVNRQYADDETLFIAPVRTSIGDVGTLAMPADWGAADPTARRALERAVTILASTAVEYIEGALLMRQRVDSLDALFRLSSLLVKADDPDKLLLAALDLALDVLKMDAGSISVLDDPQTPGSEPVLRHKATRGLSQQWLAESSPLSIDGQLRQAALRGEVVAVGDIITDPRIADASRAQAEGIVSLVSTGLIFAGRASGLIRLYSRTPRELTDNQKNLLRSIADHAAMALAHARLRQLRSQDEKMRRQLRLAADVQRRMLPRTLPVFAPFDIAAKYVPSFDLGGDFYDIFESGGKLAVVVGDVVGKGVPAALIMSSVRASVRAFAASGHALNEVIARVNASAVRDTLESEFITMWSGLVCPETLTVTYTAAGHDPALLFSLRNGRAEVRELTTYDMALAIDPAQQYHVGREKLTPGDVLVVYTDGLTDAADFASNRFTRTRVIEAVALLMQNKPDATASEIVEKLMWTIRQFAGVRVANDDITLVVLRVK